MNEREDPTAETRRRLMQRASAYTYGMFVAAFFIAVGGAALVAFLLRGTGYGFLRLWLIVLAVVLVPPLLMVVVRSVRPSGRR
jgi:Flp pilus assembly protein TadB